MKKLFKISMSFVMMLLLCVTLVGCGSISQNYADKINEKAEAEEYLTKEQVYKDLGEPGFELIVYGSGFACWYKGYDSFEDAYEAYENDKTIITIRVAFFDGNATGATYSEGEPSNK